MKTGQWIAWIVVLAFAGTAGAMETMAYRFAVEPNGLSALRYNEEIKAPADLPKSCFIGEDDELVDLSGWLRSNKVPLDGGWAIWNESRRLLVVHATMFEQWLVVSASGFESQPRLVRVNLEWFQGLRDLQVPGAGREADTSMVLEGRSGQKVSGEVAGGGEGEGWIMEAEVEMTRDTDDEYVDVRVAPEWTLSGKGVVDDWNVNTAVTVPAGERYPVAGIGRAAGVDGWMLTATADVVGLDGSPWRAQRMYETKDGEAEVFSLDYSGRVRGAAKLPGGWLFQEWSVPPEFPAILIDGATGEDVDPFAPDSGSGGGLLQLPDARVPPHLSERATEFSVDLRQAFRDKGVPLTAEDTAIYDFRASRLLICCREREILDLIEQLIICSRIGVPRNIRCETWLASGTGDGGKDFARAFVVGRSGQRSTLLWCRDEGERIDLEVEGTVGTTDELVDLRFVFEACGTDPADPWSWSRNTAVTLAAGRERIGDVNITPDGRRLRLGLRTDVLDPRDSGAR